jgi:hypothetical protein
VAQECAYERLQKKILENDQAWRAAAEIKGFERYRHLNAAQDPRYARKAQRRLATRCKEVMSEAVLNLLFYED